MSTDFTPLVEQHHARRRLAFDPTVNLGHVLTFVGALVAGVSAYSTLDKRVSVVESQAVGMKETLSDIKSDVKDLQRSLNDFSRNLGGTPTRGSTP